MARERTEEREESFSKELRWFRRRSFRAAREARLMKARRDSLGRGTISILYWSLKSFCGCTRTSKLSTYSWYLLLGLLLKKFKMPSLASSPRASWRLKSSTSGGHVI